VTGQRVLAGPGQDRILRGKEMLRVANKGDEGSQAPDVSREGVALEFLEHLTKNAKI